MKELTILQAESVNGGGICNAATVAGAVVAVADGAVALGWLALNPLGRGILIGASVGIALFGAYCIFE
jgi:hypothetical protein